MNKDQQIAALNESMDASCDELLKSHEIFKKLPKTIDPKNRDEIQDIILSVSRSVEHLDNAITHLTQPISTVG